jgi:hypothetical protein
LPSGRGGNRLTLALRTDDVNGFSHAFPVHLVACIDAAAPRRCSAAVLSCAGRTDHGGSGGAGRGGGRIVAPAGGSPPPRPVRPTPGG